MPKAMRGTMYAHKSHSLAYFDCAIVSVLFFFLFFSLYVCSKGATRTQNPYTYTLKYHSCESCQWGLCVAYVESNIAYLVLCICSGQITSNHFLILYTQLTNGFVNRTLHTTIIAMHRPTLTLLNFIPTHWVLLDLFLVSSFGRCTIFSYGDSTRVCYEIPCYFSPILSSFNFCDMCMCVCVCAVSLFGCSTWAQFCVRSFRLDCFSLACDSILFPLKTIR